MLSWEDATNNAAQSCFVKTRILNDGQLRADDDLNVPFIELRIALLNSWKNWVLKNFPLLFPLREKFPYSELFWSVFSLIWTEYREILRIDIDMVGKGDDKGIESGGEDESTNASQPAFTCPKLTIETLEQGVKYDQS